VPCGVGVDGFPTIATNVRTGRPSRKTVRRRRETSTAIRQTVTERRVEMVRIQPVRPFGRPGSATRSHPRWSARSTGRTVGPPVIGVTGERSTAARAS